ncbi:MAG: two-component system response regulator [Oscillospiraceae bacterium]
MEKRHTLLIVDDTEMNRSLLADMLVTDYEVLEASNGVQAVAMLNKHHDEIALVLLDIVMPQMDGFEVLTVMNKNGWIHDTPVITISAETSSSYIDHAYDLGATDYISRPFDEKTVQRRVRNTIMLYSKQKMLEGMVAEQIVEKEKNNFLMVEILSNIVEFRNGESGLHVLHIRLITEILLRQLLKITDRYPMTSSQLSLIVNASALHDIGKISIPEAILNKPGKLTAQEFEVMKTHSAIGAQILENAPYRQNVELVRVARDICRWHHERYDGRGYPDSLKGEEIPISHRWSWPMCMTHSPMYRYSPFSHATALNMILNGNAAFNHSADCLKKVGHLEEELKIRPQWGSTWSAAHQQDDAADKPQQNAGPLGGAHQISILPLNQ